MLQVALLCRKPFSGQFSVEGYFDRVADALRSMDVDVEKVVVPFHSKGFFRRLGIVIYAYLNQKTVIHITGDIQFAALLTSPKKTVLTVLDCQILDRSSGINKKLLRLFWYSIPVKRAAAITVISEETGRQLLKYVPSIEYKKIHVVPVSVSARFNPSPKQFNTDCPRVLQVGTKPNKNVYRLIAALEGQKCQLVIVGQIDESLKQALAEKVINFESFVDISDEELVRQYQLCDILSFVSTNEGFGMPIVEAQIVERVVVTSNCSSMPEVAGKGAFLVDPFDVESIRRGFERVTNDVDYRDKLIKAGRENCKRFDNVAIARQYLEIYQSLMNSK